MVAVLQLRPGLEEAGRGGELNRLYGASPTEAYTPKTLLATSINFIRVGWAIIAVGPLALRRVERDLDLRMSRSPWKVDGRP
jgi:hypothetical protein